MVGLVGFDFHEEIIKDFVTEVGESQFSFGGNAEVTVLMGVSPIFTNTANSVFEFVLRGVGETLQEFVAGFVSV